MKLAFTLYAPKDTRKAYQLFGATCGPCSLAAATRMEVCDVRPAFPDLPESTFTNLPRMTKALRLLGIPFQKSPAWPSNGLVLVSGPERYHSRHWVAVHQDFLYEVNLDMWLPKALWEREFLPELAWQHGSEPCQWSLESAIEVLDSANSLYSRGLDFGINQAMPQVSYLGVNIALEQF